MPALVNLSNGAVIASIPSYQKMFEHAFFATADGNTLFIGEFGITTGNITRYDVSGGKLKSVTTSDPGGAGGLDSPARRVVGTPDGTSIFYGGFNLNGNNLLELPPAVRRRP